MKKLLILLFSSSIYFVSSNASASLVGCFDCSSYQSVKVAKAEYKSSRAREKLIEVVDYKNNIVRSYRIEHDSEFGQTFVMKVNPSGTALSKASDLTSKYKALKSSIDAVNHTNTEFDSAHEIIGINSRHIAVTNNYMAQTNVIEKIGVYGGIVLGSLGKVVSSASFTIDIGFPDGSVARYEIVGIDANGNPEFTIKEAKDSDGNKIPLTKAQVNGIYNFSANSSGDKNYDGLRDVSSLHGVNVVGWSYGYGGGSVIITDGTVTVKKN